MFAILLSLILVLASDGPRWEMQEIDAKAGNVVYAITTADIDGDSKPDVIALTENRVLAYRNPTWERVVLLEGGTAPDNVCIQPHDIDGDGRIDFVIGAGWRPPDTAHAGALQWIGRDSSGAWKVHPIRYEEPSLHRLRWGDVLGNGRAQLVVAPLQGRDTKPPDWGIGAGARVLALTIPDDPTTPDWPIEVVEDGLHTIHNLELVAFDDDPALEVLLATWEGVFLMDRTAAGGWNRVKLGSGERETTPSKGASEIKLGRLRTGERVIATIEPWHGDRVVVYRPEDRRSGEANPGWRRSIIDRGISWGHAVWFADVDLDGSDELIIGQRDPAANSTQGKGPGVWLYDLDDWNANDAASEIAKRPIDDGGIATEDLVAADLDGDGRPEIVAGGRATHNVRIYWNRSR
jgi:hypothetical protein